MFVPLILAASLLAGAPSPAKVANAIDTKPAATSTDSTETISLIYVPASDLEQLLTGRTGSRDGARGKKVLMPSTLRAWSVDRDRNTLTLVGEREGIDAVKQIIRLLDVPARRLSIELRFVRLDGGADPQGPPSRPVEEDEVQKLAAQPGIRMWTLPATNNHALSFRAPGAADDIQQITPRINGDGSITLIVGPTQTIDMLVANPPAKNLDDLDVLPGPGNGVATNFRGLLALRRVPSGSVMGVAFPREGVALLIRPTLLPDDPGPRKGR